MKALLVSLMLLSFASAASALPVQGGAPVAAAAAAPPAAPAAPAAQGNLVTEAELRRVVTDFLSRKTEHLAAEISFRKIGVKGDLKLPAGDVDFEVVAPERWEGYGNSSLAVIVRVNGQVKRNLTVLVEVEALTDVVVATRAMERGEVVTPADVSMARRDLAHLQGRVVRSTADAVGLRVKNSLRANTPVRGDYLERVPVVKSGQLVTIVAENEVVRITASGRAKAAGAPGDTITVQNLSSQKEVAARVVDAATVRVDF